MVLMPHIALIGDYDPAVTAHQAIPRALELAATLLQVRIDWDWIHTDRLSADAAAVLGPYSGFWCVPASPYASFEGALGGIRFARESGRPFLGTCGGFQHAIIEHARHVLGIGGASHAELEPGAPEAVIVPLSCSLVEESGTVIPESGSRLASYCGSEPLRERYHCRYGVTESHLRLLAGTGLRVGARDSAGEVRAVELDDHPYFLATLFQPERAAFEGRAHPLIAALVGAVTAASPSATAVRPFR
jgi:CTP synthase (UTP-ammonia lyase)